MDFAKWFEDVTADDPLAAKAQLTFRYQQWNPGPILKALGLPGKQLQRINSGSFATIYQHPTDPKKVIKCTSDARDVKNLLAAQSISTTNIVKVYQNVKIPNGFALIVDFVNGPSMPYTSNMMALLLDGPSMMDTPMKAARKILQPGASPARDRLLDKVNRNSEQERQKLSELLITIGKLQAKGIHVSDWTDNIIDAGQHYVIIDMGQ
jgi:hypothetical protein